MLYDGLLNFASTAQENVGGTDTESLRIAAENIDRCMRILTELNMVLNHEVAPEFCDRMSKLYTFFIEQLSKSLRERDPEVLSGIIPLIRELRDAWSEADVKLQLASTEVASVA